jgi:dipeptide/tripeptide permease
MRGADGSLDEFAANECCERLAYYGMSTNLVNFMEDRMGMAKVAAANSVTTWSGTCFVISLLGAFLADAYLGRFWTIASFVIIYIVVCPSIPSVIVISFHVDVSRRRRS